MAGGPTDALSLITGETNRLASNPALARSIEHRFPYLDPLNHLQVELMRRYRRPQIAAATPAYDRVQQRHPHLHQRAGRRPAQHRVTMAARRRLQRTGASILLGLVAWVATCATCSDALAMDEERPVAASVGDSIPSCVGESVLRFVVDDRRVVLDDADATAVSAAIVLRYPMIEHDGLVPKTVLLWKQPRAGWVYLALLSNPDKGGEFCFTASFTASRFELTLPLLKKYFNVGSLDE